MPGPNNLLTQTSPFVGRDAELREIHAQLLILRGDLLLANGHAGIAAGSYDDARIVALRFGAPGPELRACVRLARIASADGRDERVSDLQAVHGRFTEGFDTLDLREAAAILG